jgi:hypothetical protein
MKSQKIVVFCALLCIVLFGACFSSWDGSGETVKLKLGNTGTSGVEEYTIILTSPGRSSIESEPTRDKRIVIDVPPGIWDIEVREEGPEGLTALGDAKVDVKPGETNEVHVTMYPAAQAKNWGELFNEFNKPQKFNQSQTDGETDPINYIEITDNLQANNTITLGGNNSDRNITLRTNKNVTITRGNAMTANLFQINRGSTLTLGGVGRGTITIKGNASSGNKSLIKVSGTLVMHEGVILTGNTVLGNSGLENNGGGVYVDNGGKFFMEGGEISFNKSGSTGDEGNFGGGGGVYVHTGGEFTMNKGIICHNTTEGHGGGVRVYEGTFTMKDGTISENTSNDFGGGVRVRGTFTMSDGTIYKNTSKNAGGVGIGDDTSGTGTFTMKGGTISGNEATDGDGGGVRVYDKGNFTKTGGTIYGSNEPNSSLRNKANGEGQAVHAKNKGIITPYNTTVGQNSNLSFNQ